MIKTKTVTLLVVFLLFCSSCSQVQLNDIYNSQNISPSFSTNKLLKILGYKKVFFLFSYKDNLIQINEIKVSISKKMIEELIENNDEEVKHFKDCVCVMKNNKFTTCSSHIDSKSFFAMKYVDPINAIESTVAVVASVPISILSTLVGQDSSINNTYKRAKEHAVVKIADQKLIDKLGMIASYSFYNNLNTSLGNIDKLESMMRTYDFLQKNKILNERLVKMYRKEGTFESYLKSYMITKLENDYIFARNAAHSAKQKDMLEQIKRKSRIEKEQKITNEAVALIAATGIAYAAYKVVTFPFKLLFSSANGSSYNSELYNAADSYTNGSLNSVQQKEKLKNKPLYIDGDNRIYQNGKEVAQINYSYGKWRINCATWGRRLHGDTDYHKYKCKEDVIQTALYWCKP